MDKKISIKDKLRKDQEMVRLKREHMKLDEQIEEAFNSADLDGKAKMVLAIGKIVARADGSKEARVKALSIAEHEIYEERAAIMEFEAGLPREEAEISAIDLVFPLD